MDPALCTGKRLVPLACGAGAPGGENTGDAGSGSEPTKRQLQKWLSLHPEASHPRAPCDPSGDASGPIASRLRPNPRTVDRGFFVTDELETVDELVADAEKKMMRQDIVPRDGTAALPFY